MAAKTLKSGQIKGAKCPYCPVVCQPVPLGWGAGGTGDQSAEPGPSTARDGLAAHMRVCHTELYEQWCATWR